MESQIVCTSARVSNLGTVFVHDARDTADQLFTVSVFGSVECPTCKGPARASDDAMQNLLGNGKVDCRQCEGRKDALPHLPGDTGSPRFASCQGRGRLPCFKCGGTGYLKVAS